MRGYIRKIEKVMIQFDDESVGEQQRQSLGSKTNETPIGKVDFDYSLGKASKHHTAKVRILQFPLKLAWGVTAHKFQGGQIKKPDKAVAHLDTMFDGGQTYVTLRRVEMLRQLILLKQIKARMIKVNELPAKEAPRIKKEAINYRNDTWHKKPEDNINIATLNIISLPKHHKDIASDPTLKACDIICLNETFLHSSDIALVSLPGYALHASGGGRGKGVAIFTRETFCPNNKITISEPEYQMMKLEFQKVDIIAVYLSPNKNIPRVTEDLFSLIHPDKRTLICGDFNLDPSNNLLSYALMTSGFNQIVTEPTHIDGGILDHVYTRHFEQVPKPFIHPLYFSDHDAICVPIKYHCNDE